MMREQPVKVRTGAVRRVIFLWAVILIMAAMITAVVYFLLYKPPYTPPPYELNAVRGNPEPPKDALFSFLNAEKFIIGIAGNMIKDESGSLILFFANPEENEVYLLCEIFDSDGKLLCRSGLLRPGEYVEKLPLSEDIRPGTEISVEINIYALEPKDFHSIGTVTLENVLRLY
jgi:hypothetical protein